MRVLVTAASRHGSTDTIAHVIRRGLLETGLDVELRSPDDVTSLDGFDAVVLGSAVYTGHWLGGARDFADRFAGSLAERPVFLFSSGPLGDPPMPAGDPVDIEGIVAATGAMQHRVFGGRLERRDLGLVEKVVAAGVRAPEGDFRPWGEIDVWARTIAGALLAASARRGTLAVA
jgi:menaquinone-dependent protoporphyrinogen oxidase